MDPELQALFMVMGLKPMHEPIVEDWHCYHWGNLNLYICPAHEEAINSYQAIRDNRTVFLTDDVTEFMDWIKSMNASLVYKV